MRVVLLLLLHCGTLSSSRMSSRSAEHIADAASVYDHDLMDDNTMPPFASLILTRATWTSKQGDSETEFLLRHIGIDPVSGENSSPPARQRVSQQVYEDGEPKPPEETVSKMHVLDFGYGSGQMTRLLRNSLDMDHQVHGIEISRAQAARANAATVGTGLASGIVYGTHLGFGDLPYRDNFFSHVLSQQAFSHCPDRAATFAEIFRVLQSGGKLAFQDIFVSRRAPGFLVHLQAVETAFGTAVGSISDYKKDLITAGFVDVKIESVHDLAQNIDVQRHLTEATKAGTFVPSNPSSEHPKLSDLSVENSRVQYGDVAVANALVHNVLAIGVVSVRKP